MATKVLIFPDYVGKEQPMTPTNYNKIEELSDVALLQDRINHMPDKYATMNLHATDDGNMALQYHDPKRRNIFARIFRAIRG